MDVPKSTLLEINDLKTHFFFDEGVVKAVDGVSYSIEKGKTLGVVGESGCGKSVTVQSILNIVGSGGKIVNGSIILRENDENIDLTQYKPSSEELRKIRGNKISMIFQEPMTAFSPVHKIGWQIMEALIYHTDKNKKEARTRVIDLLSKVGIPDPKNCFDRYPFELSGGMRQRAMIAMALSTMPKLLLADEPTTALDVTIQAQVINLMKDIIKEYNMGVIFITHDLGVIAQVADDVAVMYLGSVVERGPVNEILKNPKHPYTRGLLNALPDINNLDAPLKPIPGNIPSPLDRPAACVFRTRCPDPTHDCKEGNIEMGLIEVSPGHWVDKCCVNCG